MTAQNSPSFERSEILIPILDGLEANDQTLFSRNIAPPILTRLASQGMSFSSPAVDLVFQGFRDALTKRGDDILSPMRHVFEDAYMEDFENLAAGNGAGSNSRRPVRRRNRDVVRPAAVSSLVVLRYRPHLTIFPLAGTFY
jgi:hypothetical protein